MKKINFFKKIIYLLSLSPLIFIFDYFKFKKISKKFRDDRFNYSITKIKPCLRDKTLATSFDRHYIFHTAWAARVVSRIKPKFHIDISSSLYFCSIVSAFMPIEFYDYRPVRLRLSGLKDSHADLNSLPFRDESIHSLSCMHVIEHIGLGRYGDPINPVGDVNAASELSRVLAQNGSLIVVLPVGKPTIVFNAHRIYSYNQVLSMFNDLELVEFSLIPDEHNDNGIIENADSNIVANQVYGCGLFLFTKKKK